MPDFIRTASGAKLHIPTPRHEDIVLADIALGLARAPRWGGQTRADLNYSVAAHSIYVAQMLPSELKFAGLNHDDSEGYFADIPAPFKALMPQYKDIENRLMGAISIKLGFQWPVPELVKLADAIALYEERVALFDLPVGDDVPTIPEEDRAKLQVPKNWDWKFWSTLSVQELQMIWLSFYADYERIPR